MINSNREEKIIQRCLIITGLNELRGRYYLQDKKEKGDNITLRIHKAISELRDLFLNEKNQWWE